jgi:hypothetical protein
MLLRFWNKKNAVLALSMLLSVSAEAQTGDFTYQPDLVFYLDLTMSYPSQSFQNSKSYPFSGSFLYKNKEIKGFNAGASLYYFKNLGFDFMLSHYGMDADTHGLLSQVSLTEPDNQSKVFTNYGYEMTTFSTGLSYRLRLNSFSIVPKFMVGATILSTPDIDVYCFNNGIHNRTYQYMYSQTGTLSFSPSVNLSYISKLHKHFGMGFQLSFEYLYMRPDLEIEKHSYDAINKTTTEEYIHPSPKIGIFTIHAGIIFRISKAASPVREHSPATK